MTGVRFLSYSIGGEAGFGVCSTAGTGVVDLGRRLKGVTDLNDLMNQRRLAEAGAFAADPPDHGLDSITFERLLPRPQKIFCVGVNHRERAEEYAHHRHDSYPSVFVRFPDSFCGHGQDLLRPPESEQFDYEGAIVVVIGTAGRRIPVAHARQHIAGLSLANDGTVRDWTHHGGLNVTQGKNWEASGAIGPWLVTIDEFDDLDSLHLVTRVNEEVRQDGTTASMRFSIEFLVHYLSTVITLRPGDIICTGTRTEADARQDPATWLRPGDVVEVSVPEIGTLRNTVSDEPVAQAKEPARLDVLTGDAIGMRPFSQSLPMALLRAREEAMRRFRPLLAAHDLTEQQWRVLRALVASDDRPDLTGLAERTALQVSSASRIIINLEGRGLVERRTTARDQRRVYLGLTDAGRDLVRRIAPHSEAAYNRIEEEFGVERLAKLLGELTDLATLASDEVAEAS